jgi:mRNA-degrading endonuclease toxin of MazEF toxin-antitoxin module
LTFRRGEIRPYQPVLARPGSSLKRLIITADALNDTPIPVVLGLHVVEQDPGNLLAVALEDHGWAVVTMIEQVIKRRLDEPVGVAGTEEMAAVEQALRAALGMEL